LIYLNQFTNEEKIGRNVISPITLIDVLWQPSTCRRLRSVACRETSFRKGVILRWGLTGK